MLFTVLITLAVLPSYAASKDKVLFTAFNTRDITDLGNNATVHLDCTLINEGNAYDTSTGIFTAPRDGIYKFEWTFLTKNGHLFVSSLMRNSGVVAYNHAGDHSSNNWDSATQSVFLYLRKKDSIWIQARGKDGQFLRGDRHSTFSGQSI